jgi:EAL and modified HD-GYP domain-containing signal transduction protein
MQVLDESESQSNRALGAISICCAPLIDKQRKAIGTRLTMLAVRPSERQPFGATLNSLSDVWPKSRKPVFVAPLDAAIDQSALDWKAPANAVLEVPAPLLRESMAQTVVQQLARAGVKLALRGRTDVPLPPALLGSFAYTLIHNAEDRRKKPDGSPLAAPPGVVRRIPFIVTGVQTMADIDAAYERGAFASVGWPVDDASHRQTRPLQPGQAVVLELLKLVRDDAEINKIDAVLKRDPALEPRLLRLVNSAGFGSPVQITSFQHAVMQLGYKKLMRWLSLLLVTASREVNAFPLMHASILRGLFMERIGGEDNPELRDELFIAGAFSLLDRITGAPFEKLFELIDLSDPVVEAVVERRGAYAPYLLLIEAIERSDPVSLGKQLETLALSPGACNGALLEAMVESETLDAEG